MGKQWYIFQARIICKFPHSLKPIHQILENKTACILRLLAKSFYWTLQLLQQKIFIRLVSTFPCFFFPFSSRIKKSKNILQTWIIFYSGCMKPVSFIKSMQLSKTDKHLIFWFSIFRRINFKRKFPTIWGQGMFFL